MRSMGAIMYSFAFACNPLISKNILPWHQGVACASYSLMTCDWYCGSALICTSRGPSTVSLSCLRSISTPVWLATVAGNWGVTGLQNDDYDLVVAGNGTFTATPTDGDPLTTPDAGCNFTGNFTPRASGKNVFDVAVTTGAGCALVGEELSGIAMAYPLNAGGTQLVLGVSNTNLAAVVTGKK